MIAQKKMNDALPPPPPPDAPPLPPKLYMLNQRWSDEPIIPQRDIESFMLATAAATHSKR